MGCVPFISCWPDIEVATLRERDRDVQCVLFAHGFTTTNQVGMPRIKRLQIALCWVCAHEIICNTVIQIYWPELGFNGFSDSLLLTIWVFNVTGEIGVWWITGVMLCNIRIYSDAWPCFIHWPLSQHKSSDMMWEFRQLKPKAMFAYQRKHVFNSVPTCSTTPTLCFSVQDWITLAPGFVRRRLHLTQSPLAYL